MQQQPRLASRVLCLIDGYPGSIHEGREGAQSMSPGMERNLAALDLQPGRWALVAERIYSGDRQSGVGTDGAYYRKYGYETTSLNGRTYARKPHPSGLPIEAVVATQAKKMPSDALPGVEAHRFGWSATELKNAVATAKSWLFPIEGTQAA